MKTCKYCKEKFVPIQNLQYLCSPPKECSWKYVALMRDKKIKKDNDAWKKNEKEKITTQPEWKNMLQVIINTIARLIDKDMGCIATGAKTGKMNAGHYISRGSNDTARFHLDNIHLQSEHSNCHMHGDTLRYQDGIVKMYSQAYLDHLNSLKGLKTINLSISEIKDKIFIATEIRKELIAVNNTYTAAERLELRKEYNFRLGIYK